MHTQHAAIANTSLLKKMAGSFKLHTVWIPAPMWPSTLTNLCDLESTSLFTMRAFLMRVSKVTFVIKMGNFNNPRHHYNKLPMWSRSITLVTLVTITVAFVIKMGNFNNPRHRYSCSHPSNLPRSSPCHSWYSVIETDSFSSIYIWLT